MNKIAVIGAGQLGSRHLQGLSLIDVPCTFYLIDPFQPSLDQARQRLLEMPVNKNVCEVLSFTDITELPKQIDLAILATTADVRFVTLEALLAQSKVKSVVLEKVLFQREDEYERAGRLLDMHGAKAWVNCPRRVYDIYHQAREFFRDDLVLSMQVHGGEWGLGCNGIHFSDLFSYLTGNVIEHYDSNLLDDATFSSKRPEFVEFSGTLIGRTGKSQLELTANRSSIARHLIMLRAENRTCLIDERAGRALCMDEKDGGRGEPLSLPYQSQLTCDLAKTILKQGNCELPDYQTSAAIHLPFIQVLQNHILKIVSNVTGCPIT